MAFAVWLTGPPASGKSTIIRALVSELERAGVKAQVLESDRLREILTPHPSYTEEEREHFYRVLSYVGALLWRNGVNVIFDATANREVYRQYAAKLIPDLKVVFVTCSLETRKRRDLKGLYKAAMEGKITTLPGFQVTFEKPHHPNLTINTDKETPAGAAQKILRLLKRGTTLRSDR